MPKKITFVIKSDIEIKLTFIRSDKEDNRSIQKEIEWLINKRYQELKESKKK